MGMSSSQARLLSLTARQHNVEYRAQKLQAEKLQMANDSDRVYNTYLNALNATKIQARVANQWESDTFQDATLAMLEHGVLNNPKETVAANTLFLQDTSTGTNCIYVTKEVANKYGIDQDTTPYVGSMDDYFRNVCGLTDADRKVVSKSKVFKEYKPIDGTVASFTAIENTMNSTFNYNYSYTPVKNSSDPTFDEEELVNFAEFKNSHNTVTGTAVSDITSFTAGQTYTISNANDLNKLLKLSATQDTSNVKFVMTQDIDMSGVNDWSGIENFKGTFDGNGYKISNLTGSQGLFKNTNGAEIKNLELENLNITGNSEKVGGLVGSATNTNLKNIKLSGTVTNNGTTTGALAGYFDNTGGSKTEISNIASFVDVTGTEKTGGLIGHYNVGFSHSDPRSNPIFNNVYSVGDVTGTNQVGGVAGYWYSDPDKGPDQHGPIDKITDVNTVYTGGTITGNSSVGGFVGTLTCYDDYQDKFTFTNINTTSKINSTATSAGVFVGTNDARTDTTIAEFIDSGYGAGINPGMNMLGENKKGTATIPSTGGGVESFQVAGKTPSISGLTSNLIAAMIKAGEYDPFRDTDGSKKAEITRKVENFLNQFQDNIDDNKKLYALNDKLVSYLEGTDDKTFEKLLVKDIQDGTITNTAVYQNNGGTTAGRIKRQTEDQSWEATCNQTKGQMTIPSKNTIIANLQAALTKDQASAADIAAVETYINSFDTSKQEDLAKLAYINEVVTNYSKNSGTSEYTRLKKAINNTDKNFANGKLPNGVDSLDHYTLKLSGEDKTPATTPRQEAKYDDVEVTDWDYSKASVQEALQKYMLQKTGIKIIDDEQARSTEWLTNMIKEGRAQFAYFNIDSAITQNADGTKTIDTEQMQIVGTSVATETSLQEVANTENVKKAEATYEKDMKKINKKETKIDTELQQCEAERSSIKTEQDSLKQVIKDNVDLTFKLFS